MAIKHQHGIIPYLVVIFCILRCNIIAIKTFFINLGLSHFISRNGNFAWKNNGTETNSNLQKWQSAWSIFYWAWWIAFAPFVGLFLARVSRGRTIREYILGAIFIPFLISSFGLHLLVVQQ